MTVSLLAAALAIGIATTIVVMVLMPQGERTTGLEQRLDSFGATDFAPLLDPTQADLQSPLRERIVEPVIQGIGRYIARHTKAGQLESLRHKLLQAGSRQRAETLLATRVFLMPVGVAVGFGLVELLSLTPPLAILAPLLLGVLGYMYPTSALTGKIKKRTRAIRSALPGTLDLLTISMEAGLALDMAIMRVSDSDESILAGEFQQVLNEVRLGRPRSEALVSMSERNAVEELSAFVRAVVQAEPLGISITHVLRIQSEELRRLRKQRAENAGHRAPVLMLLPMMGCIFPCIFICLLGPAVLTIVSPSK
jgi:tight adherence protein C